MNERLTVLFKSTYESYKSAKKRCKPSYEQHKDYHDRGICFRLPPFREFLAVLGPRPENFSLERIDNNGHYEIGNVKWATRSEQNKNRRKFTRTNMKVFILVRLTDAELLNECERRGLTPGKDILK